TTSPVDHSSASSRSVGSGLTCLASASKSSVVSPMAETTTTTRSPESWTLATRRATFLIRSADATDVPPYFWTISPATEGDGSRASLPVSGGIDRRPVQPDLIVQVWPRAHPTISRKRHHLPLADL